MWFFLSFYQCFKIWNFVKKKQKNNKKTIEKDAVFTIDNVIWKIFHKKNVIFSKKSIFRLIMTSNIFHLKTIFYIGKMLSKKIGSSKKKFYQQHEIVSKSTPSPIVLLRNRQKVPKNYLWVLRRKLEKYDYQS